MSNDEKFDLVYKTYGSYLKKICLNYTKNLEDAEDCFQDAMVKIYNNIDNVDINSCKTFLSTITKNNTIDFLRRNKKHNLDTDIDTCDYCSVDYCRNDDKYQYKNLKEFLYLNRDTIGITYYKIFTMYVFENYKHKDIAKELGMNLNTVRVDYMKSKKIIKELLIKEENI